MASLNSQLSLIITYVPRTVSGVTGISNRLNGTNSTWPNGMPDMIKTYTGGWYQASFLDSSLNSSGPIVGTGADYTTALTNFITACTASGANYMANAGVTPEHYMRTW